MLAPLISMGCVNGKSKSWLKDVRGLSYYPIPGLSHLSLPSNSLLSKGIVPVPNHRSTSGKLIYKNWLRNRLNHPSSTLIPIKWQRPNRCMFYKILDILSPYWSLIYKLENNPFNSLSIIHWLVKFRDSLIKSQRVVSLDLTVLDLTKTSY